jgi:hypothetical protein
MASNLYVVNARGENEPFSFKKVFRSALRAGASRQSAVKIAAAVESEIVSGANTSEIFRMVKKMLRRERPAAALRFNLKEGIRRLGPTGFPFEKYIGEIFLRNGYQVKLNQHIPGRCCPSYEIDFLAQKGNVLLVGECKYHNLIGGRVALGVALENYARFLDIKNGPFSKAPKSVGLALRSILVTNTKFTSQAIKYCACLGEVDLLGWRYPQTKGLERLIDDKKLYPITILPSFRKSLSETFVSRRIMMADDILKINLKSFSRRTGLSSKLLESLAKEARLLSEQ